MTNENILRYGGGILFGLFIGIVTGIFLENIGLGIAIGVPIGVAFGFALYSIIYPSEKSNFQVFKVASLYMASAMVIIILGSIYF